MEVEAIGRVRHKNLVRLLGYCVEGAYRFLQSIFKSELGKGSSFLVLISVRRFHPFGFVY